jgi:hypothetical protein
MFNNAFKLPGMKDPQADALKAALQGITGRLRPGQTFRDWRGTEKLKDFHAKGLR